MARRESATIATDAVASARKPTAPDSNAAAMTTLTAPARPTSANAAAMIAASVDRANIAAARYSPNRARAISRTRCCTLTICASSEGRAARAPASASRAASTRERSIERPKRLVVLSRSRAVALVSSAGPLT